MAFFTENGDLFLDTGHLMPHITLCLRAFYKTRNTMQRGTQDGQDSQAPSNFRISQGVKEYQDSQGPQGPQDAQIVHKHPNKAIECRQEQKITLSTLPLDIIFLISELLSKIDSTCLGLAVKNYYPLHRARYGKVSLMSHPNILRPDYFRPTLFQFIGGFFPDLVFYRPVRKFITPERRDALELKQHEEWQESLWGKQFARERRQREDRERQRQARRMQRQQEDKYRRGQTWGEKMKELLDAEAGPYRDPLL